jgi:hypothetical protein
MQVQSGYGFVHYALTPEGIRSALMAVQNVHRKCIDQVTYDCSISRSLQEHLSMTNSLSNIVSIPAMSGVSPVSVTADLNMAGIADYSGSKSVLESMSTEYNADHVTLPLSLNNDMYMSQGRLRFPQPVPRHPHSSGNFDLRHRAAMNTAGPYNYQPGFRSTSPYQREYEPHGMMYQGEMNQSPARNFSEDSITFGTRSPSVCSADHHDMTNVSGSTSCDGISVNSPATQKQKTFTFADDISSVDSFGGSSIGCGWSPSSFNLNPPQNQLYHWRPGFDHLTQNYDNSNFGCRSVPQHPYYTQTTPPTIDHQQHVYDYHHQHLNGGYPNHSYSNLQNHAVRGNPHQFDHKINW